MEVATKIHTFTVSLKWDPENSIGVVHSGDRIPISFSAPLEFGGSNLFWSPEHLFCASISSCYATTLFHFAKLLKLTISDLRISATVDFEKQANGFEATGYVVKPIIKIKNGPNQNIIDNLLEKAKKYCMISNSIKGEIIVQSQVIIE